MLPSTTKPRVAQAGSQLHNSKRRPVMVCIVLQQLGLGCIATAAIAKLRNIWSGSTYAIIKRWLALLPWEKNLERALCARRTRAR